MENTKQIFTTLGLSLVVILSYNSGIGSSIAQQQNETTNQTQMQDQENMSEQKFLTNILHLEMLQLISK